MAKPILCLDFDGVIHSYTSGWMGADVIPDALVPGALDFIRKAQKRFAVAVASSRSNHPLGMESMQLYLDEGLIKAFGAEQAAEIYINLLWPREKPAAFVTIDDRALTFTGVWPSIEELQAFKPWNKR